MISRFWPYWNKFKNIEIIPGGTINFNQAGGRSYFVINITGGVASDGLSWGTAMNEVTTAITAQTAYRLALTGVAPTAATSYGRDAIYVMGTGTTYLPIATMPSMCDIIGVGADPFGNGTGIAVIGDATGAQDGMAGTTRGSNWCNLQFVGAGSFYAVNLAAAYRSKFENCAFGGNAASAACARAFNVVSGSGLVMRDCKTIAHAAFPVIGYAFATAGGNFNECLIERCYANASTSGMLNAGYLNNGTVIRDCICYGGTTGIADTSAQTGDGALAFYFHNFASGATNGITMTNSPERHCMQNYSVGNATSLIYYALG